MEYIDIDSTYRNRNEFPNQAQFKVLREQNHLCDTNCFSVQEAISQQSVIYPNPELNPPLAYYEEEIQEPLDTILSEPNLPAMYATETSLVYQLDEFVLRSTDPTTTNVTENALYPRGSIPLGEADEFYTGDILEDVRNKEFRRITAFRYDETIDNVFQNGNVQDATTFIDGSSFITVNTSTFTQLPFSNIDRFYQGKFLKMLTGNASGNQRLIINYTTTSPDQYTFQLQSSFGVRIEPGDSFTIVSDRKWFATVESPFTNPPPMYPCFRNLVPGNLSWNQNILSDDYSDVKLMRVYRQGIGTLGAQNMGLDILVDNGTLSASGDALGNISHLISSDQNGNFGFREVFKLENVLVKSGFGSAYIQHSDPAATIVGTNAIPNLVYVLTDPVVANNWSVNLLRGLDMDGTLWEDTPEQLAAYTDGNIVDQKITAIRSINNQTLFAAWVAFNVLPEYHLVFYEDNTGTVSVIYVNNAILQVIDMVLFNDVPTIYFRQGGEVRYIVSDNVNGTAWTTVPLVPVDHPTTLFFDHSLNVIDTAGIPPRPYLTGDNALNDEKPNILYINLADTTNALETEFYENIRFNRTRIVQVEADDDIFIVATDNANNRLWIVNNIRDGKQLLDNNEITAIDMVLNYDSSPLIVYSRVVGATTEIVSLNLSDFTSEVCSLYRIRKGAPLRYGNPQTDPIIASTTSTLTLSPNINVSDDFFNCMYIHLTNYRFVPLNTNLIFNDFLYITDYVSDTRTITFTPPLTTAPSAVVATAFGNYSTFFLEFENPALLGEDSSPNNYDFNFGGAVYVAARTDVNGLTLNDIANFDAGLLDRAFPVTDTVFQTIVNGPRITISFWFLSSTEPAGAYNIFDLAGPNTFIGILYINGNNIQINRNGIGFQSNVVYPVVLTLDTWYHLTYVHTEYGFRLYLNKEDVTNQLNFFNDAFVTSDMAYSEFGFDFNTSVVGLAFPGFMKNVLLTGQPFDQNMVISNYDSTFQTNNYISWEILGDITDNFQPLDFFGTPTPSQEVCYEMQLTHLVLPNVILKSQFGNRIAFYPYVYVEFSNLNNSLQQFFYSNNPHARTVMFKVPITDTSTPDRATFVSNRSGMNILTKFNPNDNFNFAVYLPNGELFITSESDTSPPLLPNFLLQLSATIGFKRVKM